METLIIKLLIETNNKDYHKTNHFEINKKILLYLIIFLSYPAGIFLKNSNNIFYFLRRILISKKRSKYSWETYYEMIVKGTFCYLLKRYASASLEYSSITHMKYILVDAQIRQVKVYSKQIDP